MGLFCGCVKVFVWRRKSEKMGDVSLKKKMFCLKKKLICIFKYKINLIYRNPAIPNILPSF